MTQLRHWWLKIAVALHRSVSGARGRSYADASGNPKRLRLARRQTLECLQAFGNNMEGLFVDGIDRHLRRAKQTRVIKRADFQDNQRQPWSSRCQMGPAFATKFARHGAFEIGTREFTRFAARVTKAQRLHEHEHVRRAAADILAFAAMALRLQARLALCHVANFTAIASAFEFHSQNLRTRATHIWT